jgi:hypothetical protein
MEWAACDVTEAGVFPSMLYEDITNDAPGDSLGLKSKLFLAKVHGLVQGAGINGAKSDGVQSW